VHHGFPSNFFSDLESLVYTVLNLFFSHLPWSAIEYAPMGQIWKRISHVKREITDQSWKAFGTPNYLIQMLRISRKHCKDPNMVPWGSIHDIFEKEALYFPNECLKSSQKVHNDGIQERAMGSRFHVARYPPLWDTMTPTELQDLSKFAGGEDNEEEIPWESGFEDIVDEKGVLLERGNSASQTLEVDPWA
jgi:hypothetical protein